MSIYLSGTKQHLGNIHRRGLDGAADVCSGIFSSVGLISGGVAQGYTPGEGEQSTQEQKRAQNIANGVASGSDAVAAICNAFRRTSPDATYVAPVVVEETPWKTYALVGAGLVIAGVGIYLIAK